MPTVTKPPILDSTGQAIVTALGNVSIRPQIVDNLTTTDSTKALSAAQGKVLNDKITSLLTTKLTIIEYSHSDFSWYSSGYSFTKQFSVPSGKKVVGLNGWFLNADAIFGVNYRQDLGVLTVMGIAGSDFSHISSAYKFKLFVYLIDV